MVGCAANNSAFTKDLHLTSVTHQLLCAALSPSTRKAYLRSWNLLLEYCDSFKSTFNFPCSLTLICNFVSHLYLLNLSPASIISHVSAISYVHKICNVADPTHHFVIRKILKGTQNLKKTSDSRMPITKSMLQKILTALQHTVPDKQSVILLRAIFLLAFHGFFRLGELVIRDNSQFNLVVQRNDISFVQGDGVQLILKHFKTMKNNQPITIFLSPCKQSVFCPVQALQLYVDTFHHITGPLFSFLSGKPVTHSFVINNLKSALTFCGFNPDLYKGHSFRIGAATEAAKLGFSENYIQQLGRGNLMLSNVTFV